MATILDKIKAYKLEEVAAAKAARWLGVEGLPGAKVRKGGRLADPIIMGMRLPQQAPQPARPFPGIEIRGMQEFVKLPVFLFIQCLQQLV